MKISLVWRLSALTPGPLLPVLGEGERTWFTVPCVTGRNPESRVTWRHVGPIHGSFTARGSTLGVARGPRGRVESRTAFACAKDNVGVHERASVSLKSRARGWHEAWRMLGLVSRPTAPRARARGER